MVIGADTHKETHTCAAVEHASGQFVEELTARGRRPGFEELLVWGRRLGSERVWALEDCRHVSGPFERFLLARGERGVRVAPKFMGEARKSQRERGKSDSIDALAVARTVIREGADNLPVAQLDERSLENKLLLDHPENLVAQRTDDQRRLRWHLHDLWPELEIPAGALDREVWLDRLARRLSRTEQSVRVRVARELLRSIRERTRRERERERGLGLLVKARARQLLELPGCGTLTAAKLIVRDREPRALLKRRKARAARWSRSDSSLLRQNPASPPRSPRQPPAQPRVSPHRRHQGRVDPDARAYLARKQAEGKGRMEALRCLKRHLVRRVWQVLNNPEPTTVTANPAPQFAGAT
jgi:transposase